MNRKQFENRLADKFDEFSPEYEVNSKMWDNISAELPKKKNRRKFVLIPLLIFALLGLFFWKSSSLKQHSVSGISFTNSNTEKSRLLIENQDSTVVIKEISEVLTNTAKLNLLNENMRQSVKILAQNDEFMRSANGSVKNAISPIKNIIPSEPTELKPSKSKLFSKSINNSSDDIVSQNHINNQGFTMSKMPLYPLQNIVFNIDNLKVNRLDVLLYSDLKNILPIISNPSKKKSKFSAGLTLGINNLKGNYDLNDPSFASVLTSRENSERTDPQYFAGIQIEYNLSPKWSLQSGINFYHFQDESSTVSVDTQIDTLENFQRVEQKLNGADTTIVGTAFITNTTNTEFRNYTNRQLLSIPIVLVYNAKLSQKSSLGIGLGIEKTILSNIQGVEENLNGTFYDLSLDKESRYGNRGLYGLMRLMYMYDLNSKWDLRLESNFKYELLSNYNASAPIEKSFHAVGLAISMHLKF